MTVRVLGLKSGTTAEDHRLGLSIFTPPLGGVLQRQSGVLYHPDACVLTGVSAMQAKLSPFVALVDGTAHPLQSAYPVVSDTDVIITFDAGEAGVDRVDRVIVRVKDGAYDGSGVQEGTVEYLKGQPSGAATDPPPSSMILWEVRVPAGVSAANGKINFPTAQVRRFTYTSGVGTPIPVWNQADRDALPAYPGVTVARRDTGDLEQFWAGGWRTTAWFSDTGWLPITDLYNRWETYVGLAPRVRRYGSVVELRGTVRKSVVALAREQLELETADAAAADAAMSEATASEAAAKAAAKAAATAAIDTAVAATAPNAWEVAAAKRITAVPFRRTVASVPSPEILRLPSGFAPTAPIQWLSADYMTVRQAALLVDEFGWVETVDASSVASNAVLQLDAIWQVG
ncbi:hypothetical protein ACGFNU_01825 [Spirillospora sp. NPDC048911]|uniref:hypothetical protein n=1 Tax=Spirillospora sp. NPDC048911 TaxID=3364527 RepID=UPI00371194A6